MTRILLILIIVLTGCSKPKPHVPPEIITYCTAKTDTLVRGGVDWRYGKAYKTNYIGTFHRWQTSEVLAIHGDILKVKYDDIVCYVKSEDWVPIFAETFGYRVHHTFGFAVGDLITRRAYYEEIRDRTHPITVEIVDIIPTRYRVIYKSNLAGWIDAKDVEVYKK
jgi:hypothetical protein